MNVIRRNIEAERARLGMDKKGIAEKLGITTDTYRSYVNGGRISSASLERMSDLFDCSIDYLLGKTEVRKSAG